MINGKRKKKALAESINVVKKNSYDFNVKLTIRVGEELIEQDLDDALTIPSASDLNPTIIMNLMAEAANVHARWNTLLAEATAEYDMIKWRTEIWRAEKAKQYRKELEQLKSGRITDAQVQDAIRLDPEFLEIMENEINAKKNMNHVKSLAIGFGEKREQITSIASMMKSELAALGEGNKTKNSLNKTGRELSEKEEKYNFDPEINGGFPT